MTEVVDSYARRILAQMPDKIEIIDDDGNVTHQAVANGKTNTIRMYSAWGGGSGGSTGGDTGGTTTNPGHETVGDDVYPGDVNEGEVTKRFKLWQGPSNTNADTTVTFNQDLGENLNGLGDGLQAQLSMVETPYFDGKATKSKKIQITNGESGLNKFSTTAPIPISLKKGRLASKDSLRVELSGNAVDEIIYSSDIKSIGQIKTEEDSTAGKKNSYDILNGTVSLGSYSAGNVSYNSATISTATDPANRSGTRLVCYQNDKQIATGLFGQKTLYISGLTPLTVYDDLTIRYESIDGQATSNTMHVKSFTTKQMPDSATALPPVSSSRMTATPHGNGIEFLISDSLIGYKFALFDLNNNIVAESSISGSYIYLDNLEFDTAYYFKWAFILERENSDTDKITYPSISFQVGGDGNMQLKTTRGQIEDKSGSLISTFDIIVDFINSYTVQTEVQQLAPNTYIFVGKSNQVQLSNVLKSFDNIGDGLEFNFVDPVMIYQNTRSTLSNLQFPNRIRVPKSAILNGISTFDLKSLLFPISNPVTIKQDNVSVVHDGVWGSIKNGEPGMTNGFTLSSDAINLTFQNGGVSITGDVLVKTGFTMFDPQKVELSIASISTYKEDE